jgi:hypothetical protein
MAGFFSTVKRLEARLKPDPDADPAKDASLKVPV